MIKNEKKMIDEYNKIFKGVDTADFGVWEKDGDFYKSFSLYDHSKYSTKTVTSNMI